MPFGYYVPALIGSQLHSIHDVHLQVPFTIQSKWTQLGRSFSLILNSVYTPVKIKKQVVRVMESKLTSNCHASCKDWCLFILNGMLWD